MNRADIIIGAAKVVFNAPSGAATFYSAHDQIIKLPLDPETFEVGAEGMSHLSTRLKDLTPIISITPDGRWSSAMISALWPHLNAAKNSLIFSNTDRTVLLHTQESHLYTIAAAAVHKQPQIMFSPVKSLIGAVDIVALRGNAVAWSAANSLITQATSGGTFADSGFSNSLIKTQTYTGAWGAVTGFTAIETFGDEGFVFTPVLELEPVVLTSARTVNFRVKKIGAEVSFRPANPTQAQILSNLAIQGGAATVPGAEMGTGADLTITGADGINYLILNNAVIRRGGYCFGGDYRNDMLTFVSQAEHSSGVQQAVAVLAAS